VDFKSGVNNDTYKHYIDFASEHGIEYVILDEGWSVNGEADLMQVVPEIDLPMLCRYSAEKNVGLILWAGYWAFNRDMEGVCKHYSAMGIKGWKIDFMDRDDQEMVNFYEKAASAAAKYHMLVDFHGAFKPSGLQRTWPNVLNFEPSTALFVPDSDPLKFYRRIAELLSLPLEGKDRERGLFFEINEVFGEELKQLLDSLGYTDIQIHKDIYGKDRIIEARMAR
jgi:hypothetical protein